MNALSDLQLRVQQVLAEKEKNQSANEAEVDKREAKDTNANKGERAGNGLSGPLKRWWQKILDTLSFFKKPKRGYSSHV